MPKKKAFNVAAVLGLFVIFNLWACEPVPEGDDPAPESAVEQRASEWENYASGCHSWWLTINVADDAGSLHCREVSTTRESYGSSASDVPVRPGSQTIDANSSCCLSANDEIIAVFACEQSGTAYLNCHWDELLDGTYDEEQVLFYVQETYSCSPSL